MNDEDSPLGPIIRALQAVDSGASVKSVQAIDIEWDLATNLNIHLRYNDGETHSWNGSLPSLTNTDSNSRIEQTTKSTTGSAAVIMPLVVVTAGIVLYLRHWKQSHRVSQASTPPTAVPVDPNVKSTPHFDKNSKKNSPTMPQMKKIRPGARAGLHYLATTTITPDNVPRVSHVSLPDTTAPAGTSAAPSRRTKSSHSASNPPAPTLDNNMHDVKIISGVPIVYTNSKIEKPGDVGKESTNSPSRHREGPLPPEAASVPIREQDTRLSKMINFDEVMPALSLMRTGLLFEDNSSSSQSSILPDTRSPDDLFFSFPAGSGSSALTSTSPPTLPPITSHFAGYTSRVSHVSLPETIGTGRPSVDSFTCARSFHSIPSVHKVDRDSDRHDVFSDLEIEKREDRVGWKRKGENEQGGSMSVPRPEDIRVRFQSTKGGEISEVDELMPALSLMRTGSPSTSLFSSMLSDNISTSNLLFSLPGPPEARTTAHRYAPPSLSLDSPTSTSTSLSVETSPHPMSPISPALEAHNPIMSPDDMVRAYAVRKATAAAQPSSSGEAGAAPGPSKLVKGRKLRLKASLGILRKAP
ncbi:hypothetical protein H0H92_001219 [Tricholoma furcatifolium]|nr:hypothetical protein H0H92_001219 [Tricholoma furcatifolium]